MLAWLLEESPGTYRLAEVEDPAPGPVDVVVEIRASALNHIDHWMTQGRPRPPAFPHVPGSDGAGVVVGCGIEVDDVALGDEVVISTAITSAEAVDRLGVDSVLDRSLQLVGEHRWGCHAELVVVPAQAVVPKPADVSWAQAAAYPCAFGTAWRMMRRGRVRTGERVLVTGVSGGVASAALQLCRHIGAQVVVTSRDPDKRSRALELGAVAAYDSAGPYETVDVILDSIGPAIWEPAIAALAPGGRFVTCGGTSGGRLDVDLPKLFFRQHELIGSTLASYEEFRAVTEIVASGLHPLVDEVLAWGDYPDALERLRSGAQLGKLVLDHTV